jgi:glycerol-3-phosphate dehydrogenase
VHAEVAVVGAGVVGSATALALARRGASVALVEAEDEPGLGASGANSGILHTGFDSEPGELETELILRAARLRDPVLERLGIPVLRCGALMRAGDDAGRAAIAALAANADRNGVETSLEEAGTLSIPGEAVTDPVAYTLALAVAARAHGAQWRAPFRVGGIQRAGDRLTLESDGNGDLTCRVMLNCAGLGASEVARLAGDDSFEVYPRKGEFLVFDPPGGEPLERILLPIPSKRSKGVLVFPTLDRKVVAGPTAIDQDDPEEWSVRPGAASEILPKAIEMYPALEGAEPIASYAGLRPAGRGVNYLIGASGRSPGLVNVAAIRSTGLTASLAIGERACRIVGELGVALGAEEPLRPGAAIGYAGPWWLRTAAHRSP